MSGKLAIDVTAQTTQAQKNIQNISDQIDKLASRKNSITSMSISIAAVGQAFKTVRGAAREVIAVTGEWIDNYKKSELGALRLDVIIRNLGSAAGMTTKQLLNYASALQKVTRYEDDTIIAVSQLLLETGKLNDENLERSIELSLDLAEAMGVDATSAAQTLALALQDPEVGLMRLRKAHVTFSDAEEKTIKDMTAAGDTLGAQQIILDKVAQTYGGLAREVGNVDVSKLDKIKNVWGDIKESLGGTLLDVISPALETLYGWLVKISEWAAQNREYSAIYSDIESGKSLSYYSPEALEKAREEARIRNVTPASIGDDEFAANMAMVAAASGEKVETVFDKYIEAIDKELERRLANPDPAAPAAPSGTGSTGSGATGKLDDISSFLKSNGSSSVSYQAAEYDKLIAKAKEYREQILNLEIPEFRGDGVKDGVAALRQLREIVEETEKKKQKLFEKPEDRGLADYIKENTNLSKTAQLAAIDAQIAEAESWKQLAEAGSSESQMLDEIIAKLREEKDGLNDVAKESRSYVNDIVSYSAKALGSVMGLVDQLYDNEISKLDKQLETMEEKWDKYFENLEKKHAREKSSLDGMYESGQMSAEEYEAKLAELDDARVKAEEDKQAELEKTQKRKAELEKRQFDANKANQIAQVTISGAQAIAGIWASSGAYGLAGPAIAATLTALSAASIGAQIATIASQQYVPALAEGGIVSKPTLALIGEAGPEAVVPLKKGGMSGMTVVVQVENVYTSDDLSEAVFEGISKLQKTGALPAWS